MSKTIEQLAKEHLKSTKSNGLAITYSLDELEDFAKAYQAQNEQQEVFNLEQILHDPENQPSQYGTVPLEWYENLENEINRIRLNVQQVIDSITGGSDMYAIRKQLQTAVDNKSLATYDKLSEVKHDTK